MKISAMIVLVDEDKEEEIGRTNLFDITDKDQTGIRSLMNEAVYDVQGIVFDHIHKQEKENLQVEVQKGAVDTFTFNQTTVYVQCGSIVIEILADGEPLIHADWDCYKESNPERAAVIEEWYLENEEMM